MPALQSHRWTADEVRALPEEPGKRFECVDGELLVSPGPRWAHQHAVLFLSANLYRYCASIGVGAVLMGPGELELDTYTLVQPDIFVMPLAAGRRPQSQKDTGNALLMIEVLSPGTARHDPAHFAVDLVGPVLPELLLHDLHLDTPALDSYLESRVDAHVLIGHPHEGKPRQQVPAPVIQ